MKRSGTSVQDLEFNNKILISALSLQVQADEHCKVIYLLNFTPHDVRRPPIFVHSILYAAPFVKESAAILYR